VGDFEIFGVPDDLRDAVLSVAQAEGSLLTKLQSRR
jgi:hypothetical protein